MGNLNQALVAGLWEGLSTEDWVSMLTASRTMPSLPFWIRWPGMSVPGLQKSDFSHPKTRGGGAFTLSSGLTP